MQRSHLVAFVALLVLGPFIAGSLGAAEQRKEVTVNGTVTGIDGTSASDAAVLIGDDSTLTTFSPDELRNIATDPPQNLTVVEVGRHGRFNATLGWLRAEAAVAVSDAGISDLVYIRGENATLSLQLYERRPQTVHAHLGAVGATEQRAELYINLGNSGDTSIENLSVSIVSLPDGWTVANVTTRGTYHPDTRTLTWSSVAPGVEMDDTTVVLTVPEETPVGTYTVELRAESETHRVEVTSETVEVLPEDTATPTPTPSPAGDKTEDPNTTDTSEYTPTPTDEVTGTNASPTAASGPGFGLGVAGVALMLVAALFFRR